MTVHAGDGEKLGTVRNYRPEEGFLDVRKGGLVTRNFYVPMADIDTVTDEGVFMKLTRDALDDPRYGTPPAAGDGAPGPAIATSGAVRKESNVDQGHAAPEQEAAGDTRAAGYGMQKQVRKADERATGW